jgi:glucarate dehydratase
MRIARFDVIPVEVPWAERVREISLINWRRENITSLDVSRNTFVRLHTDEGVIGVGEALMGAPRARDILSRMVGHGLWEYLLDDSIGGILMAVYDALGQATGLAVARLFAPTPRRRIAQAWWSLSYPPAILAAEAKRGANLGYRIYKIKARPWEDPVAQADAIVRAAPEMRVWADANFFWGSVGRTVYFARKLAEFPNYFGIESPFHGTDAYRQLKGQIPLQEAEHHGLIDTDAAVRERLLDAFVVADSHLGATMANLAAAAQSWNIRLWVEYGTQSGIAQVFQAQQAAAFPAFEYTISTTNIMEDDLMVEPFTMEDGFYSVPQKPGLGVMLDEKALDKYRVA